MNLSHVGMLDFHAITEETLVTMTQVAEMYPEMLFSLLYIDIPYRSRLNAVLDEITAEAPLLPIVVSFNYYGRTRYVEFKNSGGYFPLHATKVDYAPDPDQKVISINDLVSRMDNEVSHG